jgi:hypothetical protein
MKVPSAWLKLKIIRETEREIFRIEDVWVLHSYDLYREKINTKLNVLNEIYGKISFVSC